MQDHPCAKVGGAFRVWPTPAFHGAPYDAGRLVLPPLEPIDPCLSRPVPSQFTREVSGSGGNVSRRRGMFLHPCRPETWIHDRPEQLATETEGLDQAPVAIDIFFFEVIEKAASLAHDLEQTAARVVVLRVVLEMYLEALNALGEQRDLHLRRACIGLTALVGSNDFRLLGCRDQVV